MRTSALRRAGLVLAAASALLALGACRDTDSTKVQSPDTSVATTVADTASTSPDTTAPDTTADTATSQPVDTAADTTAVPATTASGPTTSATGGQVSVTVDPALEQAIASVNSLLAATDDDLAKAAAGAANGG